MDANASSNVIDFGKNRNASDKGKNTKGRHGYRAYEADEFSEDRGRELWFRIHGDEFARPDSVEMCRYIDILKVYSPIPQLLTVICEDVSFQMEGENLSHIPAFVQDRRLRALYLFNPARHVAPEADVPLIRSITRHSMVEEE